MLFDLKGKRKRLVQVVYVMLAVLFGGGLVLFGVGGNVSGGLVDAFRGGDGGTTSVFSDNVDAAKKRVARNPDSAAARLSLVRAQYQFASSTEGSDAETGALTDRGQQAIVDMTQTWERYLRLKPEKIDPNVAGFAALAYGALQEYDKAVKTQELSVEARPSANGYFQLADFAYRADDREKGDKAAKEAVRRSPSDQRNTVRSLIKDVKKQGAQIAKAVKEAEKAQKEAGKGAEPGTNFGPLPGQGQQGGQGTP